MFCYYTNNIAKLLNQLLKKDVKFELSPKQRDSFKQIKKLVSEVLVLAFFVLGRPIYIDIDALRNVTSRVI